MPLSVMLSYAQCMAAEINRVHIQDPSILVLAAGDSPAAMNNAKGHLFEKFVGKLMENFGFDEVTESDVNVSADGIELDLSVKHSMMNKGAVIECKAYSNNVKSGAFTSLYGKLAIARMDAPDMQGYLFALPKLVPQGEELVRKAQTGDSSFQYINSNALLKILRERHLVREASHGHSLVSDRAIVITTEGLHSAEKCLDPATRLAKSVAVWGIDDTSTVPDLVLELISESSYAEGIPVLDAGAAAARSATVSPTESSGPIIITTVRGSQSDFEYQLPASPKFFVGRKSDVGKLKNIIKSRRGVFVVNAQSGWGKSSLALQAAHLAEAAKGTALVVDTRTASSPAFVADALRNAALKAQGASVLTLPKDASWASLSSAIATLEGSVWNKEGFSLIFFDQFENVFQDPATTREFRDLALRVRDASCPLIIGFAWKTDLVSLTENHPYQHRDDIKGAGEHLNLSPLGARDVDTLLGRLEKGLGQSLSRDLRQRLREYSQGLPWLFKKLANHVISELASGSRTQEQLVSDALNVQSLFDADLSGLSPIENETIRYIARFAPISATDVTEKYEAAIVRSLLNARLAVAVGDKLDTYWDTFRDFLNTGSVPIEDSYIVRTNPPAVGQVLALVLAGGGDVTVAELMKRLSMSENSIHNRSREMRIFGLTAYEPNRVALLPEILVASEPEQEVRRRIERALRRHRAFSLLMRLADRQTDGVSLSRYAQELPLAFPAVEGKPSTWRMYARAFVLWFDYAGLARLDASKIYITAEQAAGRGSLLTPDAIPSSVGKKFSLRSANACVNLLAELAKEPRAATSLSREEGRCLASLERLKLVHKNTGGEWTCDASVFINGALDVHRLRRSLESEVPGAAECLKLIEANPKISSVDVGQLLKEAAGADWIPGTVASVGKVFKGWAARAGVKVSGARRLSNRS
jgi:conflict system STAND superfamily ATPase/restriction endonuclease